MSGSPHWSVRSPRVSFRIGKRDAAVIASFAAVLLAALIASMLLGDFHTSPGTVVRALLGHGSYDDKLVVRDFRLTRVLEAILVGGALGLSGAIFQTLARNPLVTPDVIGINSGASIAAMSVIILGAPLALTPPAACGGALLAALVSYVASLGAGTSRYRMLVVGVAINALIGAGTSYLLVYGAPNRVLAGYDWLLGSFAGSTWQTVRIMAAGALIIAPLVIWAIADLGVLELDDETARSLGVRLHWRHARLIAAGTALSALAVSFTGPVGFVAFICPNLARRLTRAGGATAAIASAAAGAALALVGDLVGQRIFSPTVLPVGVVTSMIGAPYFFWLLQRTARGRPTA